MADIIDRAQELEAKSLAQSLRIQAETAATSVSPRAAGYCLNSDCIEPFDNDAQRLFCGPQCAQRFEMISKLSRSR